MDEQERAIIEAGEEAVERVKTKNYSRQPRFSSNGNEAVVNILYESIYSWLKYGMDEIEDVAYQPNSRPRDFWLKEFWKLEPHFAGVINQTVLVDSSRPWTLTGGRNQVARYANVLHLANAGKGWRHFCRQQSLSYRTTDFGATTELGRQGRTGPIRAIYHVDSTRCRWSGKQSMPLYYYSPYGRMQRWRDTDFFNVCSMPNTDEQYHGLGYCATSRAFNVIKLLYGVLMHDQEAVGAKMMRGLLLLQGIEEDQWETAMEAREAELKDLERKFFGGVFVLASLGAGEVDGKLIALSQLPENFDRETFVNQVIFAYALILGYDPREFWPVSSASLGTARETESQHKKAATKGSLEFPHAWQEQFQLLLPETLAFGFEARDTDAEIMEAEMAQVWSDVARTLYDPPTQGMPGLLELEQAKSLLVQHGVIPAEWTESIEEATVASDEKSRSKGWKDQMMKKPEVQRAIDLFPNEPIVQYRWAPSGTTQLIIRP
jgi:hypothetical protein